MIRDDELRKRYEATFGEVASLNSKICSSCANIHHPSQPCPDEGAGDEDDEDENPDEEETCEACECDDQDCELCDGCEGCDCCCRCGPED